MNVRLFRYVVPTLMLLAVACAPESPSEPQTRDGVATTGGTPTDTGTMQAGTTLECGSKVYKVKTGTKNGTCNVTIINGKAEGANCVDGKNVASVTCETGCGPSEGAGDCDLKSSS